MLAVLSTAITGRTTGVENVLQMECDFSAWKQNNGTQVTE